METAINTRISWTKPAAVSKTNNNIWLKWLAMADSQAANKTLWYLVSLVAQGVLFLPLPAVLIGYFNAPVFILVITLTLYFTNIIAGMGGSNIRVILGLFAASIIVHLLMLAIFII